MKEHRATAGADRSTEPRSRPGWRSQPGWRRSRSRSVIPGSQRGADTNNQEQGGRQSQDDGRDGEHQLDPDGLVGVLLDRIGTKIHHGSTSATAIWPTTRPSMIKSTDSVSPRIVGAGYAPPIGLAYTSSWRPATFTIQYTGMPPPP